MKRTGSSWFLGEYIAPETNSGCLFKYKTVSGEWWHGVWGTSSNEFKIWFDYKELSLKPTGDAVIHGNLDVRLGAAQTNNKSYANHIGITNYIELEARWANQCYLDFSTAHSDPYLFFLLKMTHTCIVGIT